MSGLSLERRYPEQMDANSWTALFTGFGFMIGAVSLFFLYRYVKETTRLRQEAEKQTEGLVSPILILEFGKVVGVGDCVVIRNVGDHHAFEVQVQPVKDPDGDYVFAEIPLLLAGKEQTVEAILQGEPYKKDITFTTASAYVGLSDYPERRAYVTCRSVSGTLHTYVFEVRYRARDREHYWALLKRTIS